MSRERKIKRSELRGQPLAPECLRANRSPNEIRRAGWSVVGCYGITDDYTGEYLSDCWRCPAFVENDVAMYRRAMEILDKEGIAHDRWDM